MANIRSAKKRIRVIEKKTAQNRIIKSSLRTQLKKFDVAASSAEGDLSSIYQATTSKVDKAVAKGIIHKNKANRKKAQLARKLAAAK